MKPVTREQWTAALRSGEFQQCRGILYNGQGYCCLGVLGVLAGAKRIPDEGKGMKFEGETFIRGGTVPDEVGAMVGVNSKTMNRLAHMNDDGESFAVIADYIDKLPVPEKAS